LPVKRHHVHAKVFLADLGQQIEGEPLRCRAPAEMLTGLNDYGSQLPRPLPQLSGQGGILQRRSILGLLESG
jgi:hypothetical protein